MKRHKYVLLTKISYICIFFPLDMISIVTKLPTWLFSAQFVLYLLLIITTSLHDWCFTSICCYYFHLLAYIYLQNIPLLLLLLYYSITFWIPGTAEADFVVGWTIRELIQRNVLLSNFDNQEEQRPILS